jgi:hypothetical protein
MRLEFSNQSDAQALADRIHEWMQANDADYAASVEAGHTVAWAVPFQRTDEDGKVIDPAWNVSIKPRCMGALTPAERDSAQN